MFDVERTKRSDVVQREKTEQVLAVLEKQWVIQYKFTTNLYAYLGHCGTRSRACGHCRSSTFNVNESPSPLPTITSTLSSTLIFIFFALQIHPELINDEHRVLSLNQRSFSCKVLEILGHGTITVRYVFDNIPSSASAADAWISIMMYESVWSLIDMDSIHGRTYQLSGKLLETWFYDVDTGQMIDHANYNSLNECFSAAACIRFKYWSDRLGELFRYHHLLHPALGHPVDYGSSSNVFWTSAPSLRSSMGYVVQFKSYYLSTILKFSIRSA